MPLVVVQTVWLLYAMKSNESEPSKTMSRNNRKIPKEEILG